MKNTQIRFIRLRRYAWWLVAIWTLVISGSLVWNLGYRHKEIQDLALNTARINIEKDILFRQWGAGHGGVYVPVTATTQSNSYLTQIPERDIVTPLGRLLTLLNPAYMTRQLYELAQQKKTGIQGHSTSLRPTNPINAPDAWETQALKAFEHGEAEVSFLENREGKSFLRLMRPYPTKKSCLNCHAGQVDKEGDIRGGISISIPMATWTANNYQRLLIWFTHGFILLFGLSFIGLGSHKIFGDLRDQIKIEEELQRSEEFTRSIIDSSPDCIKVLDLEGRVQFMNSAGQRLMQITNLPEYLNFPYVEFFQGQDLQAARETLDQARQGETSVFRGYCPTSEGIPKWWEVSVAPIFGNNGQVERLLSVSRDITVQKQVEGELAQYRDHLEVEVAKRTAELLHTNEELEQSRRDWEEIFQAIGQPTFLLDQEQKIIAANRAALDALGGQAAEILGRRCYELLHHRSDDPAPGCPMKKLLDSGQMETMEMEVEALDGVYLVSCTPVFDVQGNLQKVIHIATDITARKRAEEALAEETIRRRILVEQSRDGIVVLDQTGKVYEANQRYAEMLGYSAEEVRQLYLWDWDAQWTREELLEQLRRVEVAGDHFETRHRRQDGSIFDVEISTNGVVLAGQKLVFCVCRDISQRKAAERALRETGEQYRLLVNQIPAVVFRGYADWSVETFDRKIESLTGYPKEDFDTRRVKWSDLILADDLPLVKGKFLEGLKTTGTYEREYRIRKKSGEIIWVQVQGRIFLDAAGRIDYISGVIFDVSDRKRAEDALLKYEFIANTAKDCMTLIDRNYIYEAANAAYCQAHGKTREEVLGNSVANIWGRKTFEKVIKGYLDRCFTGQEVEFEGWLEFGKQGRGCYHVFYSPYFDADGTVAYAAVVSHDITERRKAEEALKENERFLASIFASIQDGISILDRDLSIVLVNPAKERAFVHACPLFGKKCYEVHHGASQPCDICPAVQTLETGQPAQVIVTRHLSDREGLRHINLSTFPLIDESSGQVTGVVEVSRDITEQKQAEEAIRERERMLSLVINAVPQVIFWKDLNSVYLGCNQNYAQAAGLETPDVVVGRTEYDLPWTQEETETYLAEDREVMQTRQAKYHQVEPRQLADGRRIWVDGTKLPLLADDGTVMGVLGVYDDITERKRMEEELRESETSYRTLAQNLPGLVYRVFLRENFRMEFYNDALQSMTGYTHQELSQGEICSLDPMILPEDREKVVEAVKQAIDRDQVFEVEYRFRHKDGFIRYFAERGKPIPGEDGRFTHIDGVIWDITEAKQLEAAIQESERRFRGLVENVPMGIMIVQDEHIVYQNPEQERLIGHLQIQNSHDLARCAHPEDLAKARQFCYGITTNQPQADITLRFLPLGSSPQERRITWVNCRAAVTEYRRQKAMLINMVDITHTKELEHQMLIREKMASLGQVAAGIAHEIRNPLSGINVFLDGIKENFQDSENTAIVQELIEAAQATSNRIEAVIRRVLDFSRPAELKLAPTNINLAVDNAIKLTATSLRKEDIKIDSNLAADLPLVNADLQLLEQVLVNIITNAAEALRGAGEPGQMQVATQKAQEGVLIVVQDSGPGIPPEFRDKIFDPFFTTKADGSGIGLSLCQRIIADHGGTIEVSASDLGGTQFIIHLPRE